MSALLKIGEEMQGIVQSKPTGDRLPIHLRRITAMFFVVTSCLPLSMKAQGGSEPQSGTTSVEPENVEQPPIYGVVRIDGQEVLTVYETVGPYNPQQRADKIAERIIDTAQDPHIPAESVGILTRNSWTEIAANGKMIMAVTEVDSQSAGKPQKTLALEDAGNIRQAILTYRREHGWSATIRHILYTLLVTALLLPIGFFLHKLHLAIRRWLQNRIESRIDEVKPKTALQICITYGITLILTLGRVFRWLIIIAVFEAYLTVVLSFYPSSRSISRAITGWIFSAISAMGTSFLNFLPNLFVIAFIVVIATQVIRFITMIFEEIRKENLTIPGFYPEWADPTVKLVRSAVVILVIVVIFPYLPGSQSPAFRGISIFVGVLLSLGSSSAVANAIAGVILTYMRSFSVGDWVKIGDVLGEVVEKNMLVTRIMTMKQEVITIPNGTVMNGSVMNYTREAKHGGVIFHTTVTIGYDAPWKKVHQLLNGAALATEHVLQSPPPFVLQTALNDFFVSYELNAFTDTPRKMQFIYSQLHQNIQDKFNEAGVEICSPHFSALRDGNSITIPAPYIDADYAPPAFRVEAADKKTEKVQTR